MILCKVNTLQKYRIDCYINNSILKVYLHFPVITEKCKYGFAVLYVTYKACLLSERWKSFYNTLISRIAFHKDSLQYINYRLRN